MLYPPEAWVLNIDSGYGNKLFKLILIILWRARGARLFFQLANVLSGADVVIPADVGTGTGNCLYLNIYIYSQA